MEVILCLRLVCWLLILRVSRIIRSVILCLEFLRFRVLICLLYGSVFMVRQHLLRNRSLKVMDLRLSKGLCVLRIRLNRRMWRSSLLIRLLMMILSRCRLNRSRRLLLRLLLIVRRRRRRNRLIGLILRVMVMRCWRLIILRGLSVMGERLFLILSLLKVMRMIVFRRMVRLRYVLRMLFGLGRRRCYVRVCSLLLVI